MFIGHYAVALAAKKAAPKTSLGTLVMSAQFLDLLWPLFLLLGLEHVRVEAGNTAFTPLDFYDYPISHSLATALGWSVGFALVYMVIRRNLRSALVLAGCVFSHWVLDFITHRPDLPIAPGMNTFAGLGLWNSVGGTIIIESLLFLGGVFVYARTTRALDKAGTYAFWSLIVLLAAGYTANITAPPPTSATALGIGGLTQWLVVAWAYWIDRHRTLRQ